MNITSRKLRLIFEMKLGEATSSLVSEIFRAIEGTCPSKIYNLHIENICRRHSNKIIVISVYQTAKSPAAEFLWIEKLTRSTRNLTAGSKDMQDAVESVS